MGSPAKNAGGFLSGYNDRVTDSDFTVNPIRVSTVTDSIPDIGAWMVKGNFEIGFLSAPINLQILSEVNEKDGAL